jgi:2-polyprenyl-3-methyl-5-hydroxy-6-metoxy-1,4-benzoquinol methylase
MKSAVVESWPDEALERLNRCPVCGETRRSTLYTELTDRDYGCAPGTWTLRKCQRCSSAYLDPRPTQETIDRAYANYYEGALDPRQRLRRVGVIPTLRRALRNGYLNARYGYSLRPASRIGAFVAPLIPRQKERADRSVMYLLRTRARPILLDVGCGDGAFLLEMQAAGWSVVGIEPNADAVALARGAGLDVRSGVLEREMFPAHAFDAITLMGVLELLHDPVETLKMCRNLLRPGGVLAVATPNLSSQGHAFFGRDWLLLSPPRSLVLFTPDSLTLALHRAGFERVELRPSRRTEWVFRLSAVLAAGAEPFRNPRQLPWQLRVRARIADFRAAGNPRISEELICLGRTPSASNS